MKRLLFSVCMLAALPVMAQETYQNATVVAEDLNGTARYVGMGGAMEALGADISTIATNPAGIGLFRSSSVNATASVVAQGDAKDIDKGNKTMMSFDQIGFVVAHRTDGGGFLNFGYNYHKSRNFNQILTAANKLGNGSQNILSYANGMSTGKLDAEEEDGTYYPVFNGNYPLYYSQLDELYNQALNFDPQDGYYYSYNASDFNFARAQKGYIGEYDFNISGNIKDRVYLGLTIGIHDVHYRSYTNYMENLMYSSGEGFGSVNLNDERKITGTGYDIKAGIIVRPIEESAFRIGASVASPIFYDLKTYNYTKLNNNSKEGAYDWSDNEETYEFRLNTPWKFGLSLGHTVGNYLALGASYEYAGYDHIDSREKGDEYYDFYYDSYYSSSASDDNMNDHTEATLKGVSTLKLGIEYKPIPEIAFRAGYNYVSPMYNEHGMKEYADQYVNSLGTSYTSTTDYTNWKATHRLTLGVGYNFKGFSADLAYQYNTTKGDFYPFQEKFSNEFDSSYCSATKVDYNRHQFMLTLGYRF